MKRTVFFSWQSDLPNTSNRNFIEESLKSAIKRLKNDADYKLQLSIDRDTKYMQGMPDISDSIFKKIDQACFFVADISIINGNSRKYKKTPNPNVLIELGYAAKKLGWDRIICLFNTEYGELKDLPFDLRNRRVLSYRTNIDKTKEKQQIIKLFTEILKAHYKSTLFSNELMDYYNGDIYLSLLRLVMDFAKMIYDYSNIINTLETVQKTLNIDESELKEKLSSGIFIGFKLFKSYKQCVSQIALQLEKIVPIKNFDDDYYVPIVRLINILRLYDKELNRRGDLDKLILLESQANAYQIIYNTSSEDTLIMKNRLALIKSIAQDKGVVVDYGDFQRKDHIDNLLNEFQLKPDAIKFYTGFIFSAIIEINHWIDNNDGEFIIDQTQVEIYRHN